jgi:hypothetical protein
MKRVLLAAVATLACLSGCSSARWAAINAAGKSHHIKQFSGGKLIGEFDSVGIVNSEPQSDGYFFEDRVTHTLVTVSGDVQITIP